MSTSFHATAPAVHEHARTWLDAWIVSQHRHQHSAMPRSISHTTPDKHHPAYTLVALLGTRDTLMIVHCLSRAISHHNRI